MKFKVLSCSDCSFSNGKKMFKCLCLVSCGGSSASTAFVEKYFSIPLEVDKTYECVISSNDHKTLTFTAGREVVEEKKKIF